MNILLVAINAKYIHSNLAVYSLKAYAQAHGQHVELAEFTINQKTDTILEQIYRKKPDVVAFSCYIWNISYIKEVAQSLHQVRPNLPIWVGGPEVSFETEAFLTEHPYVSGVMMGEGERTFWQLCELYDKKGCTHPEALEEHLEQMEGISFRRQNGAVEVRPLRQLLTMDEIPFAYQDLSGFEHRIIYYESSRGCPFSCSYCLSSVDKTLRFRSLPMVFEELQFFLDHKVPQVKFVDRTFNCRHDHAMAIWKYIHEHDNGVTNFHFEVSSDLLNEEELTLMEAMRPGLIQLEIGVQSTHPKTIREIHRTMHLPDVKAAVARVAQGRNIHQHLDLIAGLPYEDYETFRHSFDEIYAWKPEQLQLGFLKVLKGSYMYEHAQAYDILYRQNPPYEVLATRWVSYEEMLRIHLVEEMLELHYNSGQYLTALMVLEEAFESPFAMFLALGEYYRAHGYLDCSQSRVRRTEIFLDFAREVDPTREILYREALLYDLYKIEKSKSRPSWAPDPGMQKKESNHILHEYGMDKKYCHLEPFTYLETDGETVSFRKEGEPRWLLFDYEHRHPLTNAAAQSMVIFPLPQA